MIKKIVGYEIVEDHPKMWFLQLGRNRRPVTIVWQVDNFKKFFAKFV